jgi:hypothetical protein
VVPVGVLDGVLVVPVGELVVPVWFVPVPPSTSTLPRFSPHAATPTANPVPRMAAQASAGSLVFLMAR